jgi:Ca2+-binding RTX toxin-like protein
VKSSITVKLATNVEKAILTGSGSVNATGNAGANTLTGNSAANTLNGLGGKDLLIGGTGADKFVFSTALSATKNVDVIQGFQVNIDEIRLENGIFKSLVAGNLATAAFKIGATATDATDRIIYEKATGKLFYDADGNGAGVQVQFAKLAAGLALDAGDFFVI